MKGTLIPIGGNEDKGLGENEMYTQEFIEEGILSHVLREAGGKNAKVVVIPTASSIPVEVGENYIDAFNKLGCKEVHVLDIRKREQSSLPNSIKLVKEANCIMFSGGDQSKITNKIGGTILHEIMMDRYNNEEGFVIAGTSAGAMAMSEEMIAGGSSTEAFVKGAVLMYHGLGLLPKLIIDTHFIQRGRFGRLAEGVAKYPKLLGLGLAEDTGVIIKEGKYGTVIGSGMIILFDAQKLTHNNENLLTEGTPMSMSNLVVHVLSNGDKFNIDTREITVLPLEAPFV